MAVNVCHAEAHLWRRLARSLKAKSRGHFQKMVLLLGLAQLNPVAARELTRIRAHYRQFGAVALLLVLCGGWLAGSHDHQRCWRTATRGRVDWAENKI